MNKHLIKKYKCIENKHIQSEWHWGISGKWNSLYISEKQIKITMITGLSIGIAKNQNQTIPIAGENVWQHEISFMVDRNTNSTISWKDILPDSYEAKYSVTIWCINCAPVYLPNCCQNIHPYKRKNIADLFSSQNLEGNKMTFNRWLTTKCGTVNGDTCGTQGLQAQDKETRQGLEEIVSKTLVVYID